MQVKTRRECGMRKIALLLLAAIFAVSTVAPLVISADTAMAASHVKAKDADKDKDKAKAKKPAKKKAAKKAAKKKDKAGTCGTYMYYDKKAKKCADARGKK